MTKDILSTDIYNVNKTGFRLEVKKNQVIVTKDIIQQTYIDSFTNRESIACVVTASSDGNVLPPMFIFFGF